MKRARIAAPLLAALLLGACGTNPAHENFKQVMNRQVGKHIDDSDAYPVFYRLRQLDSKSLPNGHRQEQYAAGRGGECRVFFEVEPVSQEIVRWAFDGSERECVIPARTPN